MYRPLLIAGLVVLCVVTIPLRAAVAETPPATLPPAAASPVPDSPAAQLTLAAALVARWDNDLEGRRGLALLQQLAGAGLSPGEELRRQQGLAQGYLRLNQSREALLALHAASTLASAEARSPVLQQAYDLLRERFDTPELATLATQLPASPLRLVLQTERARRAWRNKEPQVARALLDEVLLSPLANPFRSEALQLRDQIDGTPWQRRALGVLLPLSGKYSAYGEALQRGIELAIAERSPKSPPFTVLYRDAGSDADENLQALTELVEDQRVMAVLGPLTGHAALAAGAKAQQLRVPLVSLAPRNGVAELGDFVFRDALTPDEQIETLLRQACDRLGLKRFAILAPANRHGQELADLFSRGVEARGAKVVARQSYDDTAIDFRTPVKLLKGENPDIPDPDDKAGRRSVHMSPPKPPPFDALFIPDVGERVALIAPFLAFYGLDNVQLLGDNGWNTPELLEKSPRYVDGALFVDGFYAASEEPQVFAFVERFRTRYQDEPSILDAEGYDMARLFMALLDRPELRTRIELRAALEGVKNFSGVTGSIGFDAIGDSIKPLKLLQVQNGSLVELTTTAPPATGR